MAKLFFYGRVKNRKEQTVCIAKIAMEQNVNRKNV